MYLPTENNPGNIYLLKINRNTKKMCEICSKLTTKTLERRQWCRFGVFIVNFEYISHLFLLLLLTLSMYLFAGKKCIVAYDLLFSWKQAAVNEVNSELNKNQNINKKTSRL